LELAKDVGALANASGGVLVIGLKTRNYDGRDVVASVAPVPLERGTTRRYEKMLRRLLHPPPRGLLVEALPRGEDASTGLVLIEVPSQDDEVVPVLIRDGLNASMGAGTLIGIPIRAGEDVEWLTAERLHTWLRAGRRLIG
jgi:hypothetical protein